MFYLETERLLLKPHTLANVNSMQAWENDPDLLYYSDNQPEDREPQTVEDITEYLTAIMQESPLSEIIHYAIHKRAGQELIGYGMIALIDRYHRQCKMGIVIGEKQEWGQGYAQEALQAVIAYCFTHLNMNRIGAEVYDFNQRAIQLFERFGFKREGTLRGAVLKKGKFANEYVYGLLRQKWKDVAMGRGGK